MSKKQKREKMSPVTAEMVARLVDSAGPGWYDRKSIAEALGRKKTSHVIRMIDAAAEARLIVREYWTLPGEGRYKAVYASNHLLGLDQLYDEFMSEREPNPGSYTMPERMFSDGREDYGYTYD